MKKTMKKRLADLSLAIVATVFSGLSNAETWAPLDTRIILASDSDNPLEVTIGFTLLCDLYGIASINPAGNYEIKALALSRAGETCGLIGFYNFPYVIEAGKNNVVTIKNVDVRGVTDHCFGNLVGTLNQVSGEITLDWAEIPSNPAGGDPCVLDGTASTTPTVSYTP